MVENAEAVTKIHAVVGQRHGVERRHVKGRWVGRRQQASFARHPTHPRWHRYSGGDRRVVRPRPPGPAAAAATGIESRGITRQTVPREDREIFLEHPLQFLTGHSALVEALPFPAEIADGGRMRLSGWLAIARF